MMPFNAVRLRGFAFCTACECRNEKLSQWRGAPHLTVDRNEAAESSASKQYAR